MGTTRKPLRSLVAAPVDGGSLRVARAVLGAVGVLTAIRIVHYGWIDSLYAGPTHRFTYLGFGWVPQPSHGVMVGLVVVLGLASAALVVGRWVRPAAGVVALALAWIELIDVTTYLNHYWAMVLVAFLLALARPTQGWIWLLRFQVGVVYVFAGVAKLRADWLVDALPLRLWLPARAHLPIVGPLLTEPATAHVLSVAGAVFDCAVVPLLLWRRTRPWAWGAVLAFHVCTWFLFPIGVFPWLMIGLATLFFAPDWPRTVVTKLRNRNLRLVCAENSANETQVAGGGVVRATPAPRWVVAAGVAWCLVQVLLPLREHLYPGDARWTGEGYRFSWNVLLTERAGSVTFLVTEPNTGRHWTADASELYTPTQLRVMSSEPDLIQQVARAIAAEERAAGREVEVRVDAFLSFNGRPAVRSIDPQVDLAHAPRGLAPKDWILPRP